VFAELLDRVLHGTPGALSVTLMGFDGIAIDTREALEAAESTISASAAAVELGFIASQLKRVAEGLGAGDVREVSVHTNGLVTLLRPITPEYFIALSMSPEGNTGKGRYLMRVVAPKLAEGL
jgi:predicted regulator of Ras-like GTPase activity (Roadblock/LC7/MglB family)